MFRDVFRGSTDIHSDDQKSDEWLKWRIKGIGSSDAVVLAGLSPWRTIQELWTEKVTGESEVIENWAMKRGKELEPVARDIYEYQFKITVPATNVIHPVYSYMKASLDGFNKEKNLLVEFKVPGQKDLSLAKDGEISPKYYAQVQWQLMVSCADLAHYVCYDQEAEIYIVPILPNLKYQKKLMRLAKWFWAKVQSNSEIKDYGICLPMPKM